jgi:predicted aconitase with swiveling domain
MKEIQIKPLVAGDFSGNMLVAAKSISFFGDIDGKTGTVVSVSSDLYGRSITGAVLCLPFTSGSSGAWHVLRSLRRHGTAPVAIILNEVPDPTLIQGAIMAKIPVVRPLYPSDFSCLVERV